MPSPTAKNKLHELLKVPNPKENCTAMRHLSTDTGAMYCMYDLMVAYAKAGRKSREGEKAIGPLIFNASMKPTMCNELGVSVNTAYRWCERLQKLGWIVLVKQGNRRDDGRQEPNTYRVVEHDEFIATHLDSCPPYTEPYDLDAKEAVRALRRFVDDTSGRSYRFVGGDRTTLKAVAECMANLTPEEQAEIIEHWKSIEPDPSVQSAPHKLPVPLQREQAGISTEVTEPFPTHGFAGTYP
jgi:Helix-turn-helix domain